MITYKIKGRGWTEVYCNDILIGDLINEYSPALNSGAVGYVPGSYVWNFCGAEDAKEYHRLTLAICSKVCGELKKSIAKGKIETIYELFLGGAYE